MRKFFLVLAAVLSLAASAAAQTTLVTGTVKDTNGLAYAAATIKAQLVLAGAGVNGQPTVLVNNSQQCLSAGQGSAPCQVGFQGTNGPITLDTTGSFSLVLQDNALVTPAGTQWLFSVTSSGVPPPLGTGPQSCSATITITGASQSISASFSACPALANPGAAVAIPGGSPTQSQVNNGGVLGGTPCQTFPSLSVGPVNVDCDFHSKGPNPYVDVTRYNVRALVPTAIPVTLGITANINSGSAIATASTSSCPGQTGNVCFSNGDGVVIYGAGTAHSMTTPAGVTVTPSLAQAGTGTGLTVPGPVGATTYNYQVIARDKNGGITAASTVASTVTGAASLGQQTIAISTLTRSGNVTTVTTAAPHGLAASGNNNPMVYIRATSDDINFGGWFAVTSAVDNTHFTFNSGLDTVNGAPTSATGGSVIYFNVNHVTWTLVTGAWEYCVYGRTGGSLTWIGCSRPQQTSGFTNPVDLTFDDFGSTMMANFQLPGIIPNTPPGSATSDSLVTTIVSGAGTTTLTLANTASTTVTGNPIRFDNAPNILTAANVATNGNGLVHFPTTTNAQYPVNSYLKLPQKLTVSFSGPLYINDTIEVSLGSYWTGNVLPQGVGAASFAQNNWILIGVHEANPGVYSPPGSITYWKGLQFLGQGLTNGGLMMLADENTPITFEDVDFIESTSSTSFMGVGLILRGDAPGTGNSSFVNIFTNVLFSGGPAQVDGTTATPFFYCNGCGLTSLQSINLTVRSIFFRPVGAGGGFELQTGRQQGGITPLVTYFNNVGNSSITSNTIRNFELDSGTQSVFANLSGAASLLYLEGAGYAGFFNGATGPIVTGNPIRGIFTTNELAVSGQNQSIFQSNYPVNILENATSTTALKSMAIHRMHDHFPGSERLFWDIGIPGSPTATVAAGGILAQPVTYTYKIAAVGFDGGAGSLSTASTSCTTSAGNQTCNVSWTAVLGANQYVVYRATGGGYIGLEGGGCNPPQSGTTFSDNGSLGTCNPPPVDSASGVVYANKSEIAAPTMRQVGTGTSSSFIGPTTFANLGTPANGTFTFCPDCTIANPCAGAGTGAFAKRLNGVWVCN